MKANHEAEQTDYLQSLVLPVIEQQQHEIELKSLKKRGVFNQGFKSLKTDKVYHRSIKDSFTKVNALNQLRKQEEKIQESQDEGLMEIIQAREVGRPSLKKLAVVKGTVAKNKKRKKQMKLNKNVKKM